MRNPFELGAVEPSSIALLATILTACRAGSKVSVWYYSKGEPCETVGIARHVVRSLTDCSFPAVWTPECALRITATFERFITLSRIISVEVLD